MAFLITKHCLCGCGASFTTKNPKRVYLNTACQVRHFRAKSKEQHKQLHGQQEGDNAQMRMLPV